MQPHPAFGIVVIQDAEIRRERHPGQRGELACDGNEIGGQRRRRQVIEIASRRLVGVRLAVPVASYAEHPFVHLATAAYNQYVGRYLAIDQGATAIDERALTIDRQRARQMKRARRDLHDLHSPYVTIGAVDERSMQSTLSSQRIRGGSRKRKKSSLRALRALRSIVLVTASLFVLPAAAAAHPVPFSYLDLHLQGTTIEGSLVAHMFDVAHDLNIDPPERLLDPAVASQQARAIADLIGRRLTITADERRVALQWRDAEVVADRQSIRLPFSGRLDSAPGVVAVEALLFPYDPNHQTFLSVYDLSRRSTGEVDGAKAEGRGGRRGQGGGPGAHAGHPRPRPHTIRLLRRDDAGRVCRRPPVRARRRAPHPDRPGSPAVPGRAVAAGRIDPAARDDRHRV